jgi:hypothetical protein
VSSRGRIAAVAAVLSLMLTSGAVAADTSATYTPPFAAGPQGGDSFSHRSANTEDGRVLVGRAYPVFNPIQCGPGGAFARLQVNHTITAPITKVSATFTEALVDPYTFVSVALRDAKGNWLASTRTRGPITEGDTITANLFKASPQAGQVVTVQFGLDMASACPHVNGGTARFTTITVS